MSDDRATDTGDEAAADTRRIRDAYAVRDRRPARGKAIAEAYRLLNEERRARTLALLQRLTGREHPTVFDVGCGGGLDLEFLLGAGWPPDRLAGADLVEDRVAAARIRCPGVRIEQVDGTTLPFADGAFDIATAVTVFSSIPTVRTRAAVFAEMERVVRPGGAIVVYDFVVRNPTNADVLAMPLRRLTELAGRPPDTSTRLSPLLYLVALASVAGPHATGLAMRVAPPTHRLSIWRREMRPDG